MKTPPWHVPFLIWNKSVFPCPVLTVASWPAYRFLRRQVRWSDHLLKNFPQFVVIYTVKGFGIVNKTEVDDFSGTLFFNDPAVVGILISGSSAFSKSSLNIWKLMVHMLLKPGLGNSEHHFFLLRSKLMGMLMVNLSKQFICPVLYSIYV